MPTLRQAQLPQAKAPVRFMRVPEFSEAKEVPLGEAQPEHGRTELRLGSI